MGPKVTKQHGHGQQLVLYRNRQPSELAIERIMKFNAPWRYSLPAIPSNLLQR